jgi:putative FmdB family regulatory protein
MPNYDYQCKACNRIGEIFLKLEKYADRIRVFCPECGETQQHDLVISRPFFDDWDNGGAGRWFEHLAPKGVTFHSRGDYKKYLKEHGIREWEPAPGMPSNGKG